MEYKLNKMRLDKSQLQYKRHHINHINQKASYI
jgi:hypothetical protein